jgi:hypothetical protein
MTDNNSAANTQAPAETDGATPTNATFPIWRAACIMAGVSSQCVERGEPGARTDFYDSTAQAIFDGIMQELKFTNYSVDFCGYSIRIPLGKHVTRPEWLEYPVEAYYAWFKANNQWLPLPAWFEVLHQNDPDKEKYPPEGWLGDNIAPAAESVTIDQGPRTVTPNHAETAPTPAGRENAESNNEILAAIAQADHELEICAGVTVKDIQQIINAAPIFGILLKVRTDLIKLAAEGPNTVDPSLAIEPRLKAALDHHGYKYSAPLLDAFKRVFSQPKPPGRPRKKTPTD